MSSNWQPQAPINGVGGPIEGGPDGVKGSENEGHGPARKKVVIVGLGMVGISFMSVKNPRSLMRSYLNEIMMVRRKC